MKRDRGRGYGGSILYPSNVYKSYPFEWLSEGRYEKLTKWLQQLTAHDLSNVDLEGVETLDEWFDRLEATTDLRVCHSSSTTGKLSFVPRGVDEWVRRTATMPFGYEAGGNDEGPEYFSYEGLPLISTFYRGGHSAALAGTEWQIKAFHDPDGTHPESSCSFTRGRSVRRLWSWRDDYVRDRSMGTPGRCNCRSGFLIAGSSSPVFSRARRVNALRTSCGKWRNVTRGNVASYPAFGRAWWTQQKPR